MEDRWDEVERFLSQGIYPSGFNKCQRLNLRRYSCKFSVNDGELYVGKRRAIKLKSDARKLFDEFHCTPVGEHPGVMKTREALCSRFYWKGMSVDIDKWVLSCDKCQRAGRPRGERKGFPPISRAPSRWAGFKDTTRKIRSVKVGWMDFDEKLQRYRQVSSMNGGGTKHISVIKCVSVADIQVIAENLFFPNGHSAKKKPLLNYLTHMESSQTRVDLFNTVEELYNQTRVRILRLNLHTKKRTTAGVFQPSFEQSHAVEGPSVESASHGETNGFNKQQHFSLESDGSSLNITEVEETPPERATLTVRKGHCLTDLICAFKDPGVLQKQLSIKMRSSDGRAGDKTVLRDCLVEFWGDFYGSCTLGDEAKVPLIRCDFQSEEWQAVARVFVLGWNQVGYFPVELALPFLEEVLYGSTVSSIKDSLLLYVSREEREVLSRALADFHSVDTPELLHVLGARGCKQVPTVDSLDSVLTQIGHKELVQVPMYVIKCWHPIVAAAANLPRKDELRVLVALKKETQNRQSCTTGM